MIIPMAGSSTRFNTKRPKWMLTHPKSKRFMCLEAISKINLDFFDKFYFICLKEHENTFHFEKSFLEELEFLNIKEKSKIIFLDHQTNSQSETVSIAIEKENINGFIFIKDCDSFFEYEIKSPINQVCFMDLHNIGNINAKSKSYIDLDDKKIVKNIVEKNIISNYFSVGGYGFQSAAEFLDHFKKSNNNDNEIFVSDIIFSMLLDNKVFAGQEIKNFEDWGTQIDWDTYCSNFKTLFIDLDGTLVKNSSIHFPPYCGTSEPLIENISHIRQLYSENTIQIIITTSRPEYLRDLTEKELKHHKIPYDLLIMDLYHSKRIIINDYSDSNIYPSCEAINILRDTQNIKQLLN